MPAHSPDSDPTVFHYSQRYRAYDYLLSFGLNISMANKLTRIQPKSRYLEAANALTPLTMLTAAEARSLSTAGQEQIGSNEELIYKYRDEFLYIQRAAEQGLTSVDVLIDDPNELSLVAVAWGFTCLVLDKFAAKIVYRKNLGQEEIQRKLSNITIDWSKPKTPSVDVAYYRQSGNLVALADSSMVIPDLEETRLFAIKQQLGITDNTRYYSESQKNFSKTGQGLGGRLAITQLSGNNYTLAGAINDGGSGYRVGDVIRFSAQSIGVIGQTTSITLANELRITVASVDKYGSITGVSLAGQAVNNRGYTIIDLGTGAVS